MRRARTHRSSHSGLTLVEASIVVSLIAIALAVFVPTFVRELHTSKTDEASEMLDAIAARAVAYYESRHAGGRACLPGLAGPTPREPVAEPTTILFDEAGVEGAEIWAAIGFQPARPIRYSYTLDSTPGCAQRPEPEEVLFTIRAEGDLDADGELSSFEREYGVDARGHVVQLGVTHIRDAVE